MGKLKKNDYESLLEPMQVELNNLAHWVKQTGARIVVVVEGRDTAGKGGVIGAIAAPLNPRQIRIVALAKPTERERTQWYFQRYVPYLPAAGEIVVFDRSWYNRAGVEKVMGYCTRDEYERFLKQAPMFEQMLIDDGILLFKYWLSVDQEHQEERFAERAADPMKRWKLSPIDLEARTRYLDYGQARDAMFVATHTAHAPWVAVNFNDQRRGRLTLIRHLLDHTPDVTLAEEPFVLPPLPGAPQTDHFNGPVTPISDPEGWSDRRRS